MQTRLDPFAAAPAPMKRWLEFGQSLRGLEAPLQELVKIRSSQLNGCANCLHMHTRDARRAGESEERIYLLDAWRESPLYTSRERAALAWTEALTLIGQRGRPEDAYRALEAEFTPAERVELTLLVNVINGWNRIAVGFGIVHPVETAREAAA